MCHKIDCEPHLKLEVLSMHNSPLKHTYKKINLQREGMDEERKVFKVRLQEWRMGKIYGRREKEGRLESDRPDRNGGWRGEG